MILEFWDADIQSMFSDFICAHTLDQSESVVLHREAEAAGGRLLWRRRGDRVICEEVQQRPSDGGWRETLSDTHTGQDLGR